MGTEHEDFDLQAILDKCEKHVMYSTTNYEIFNFMKENRDVKPNRVKAIRASIEKIGYMPVPILCNELLDIEDGQGRVTSVKEIAGETGEKIPIYFVIKEGIGAEECRVMNTNMTNWGATDFIDSYARSGNIDYVKLLDMYEEYKDKGLNIIDVAMCLSNSRSKNIIKPLRKGTYKYVDNEICLGCLDFLSTVAPEVEKIKGGGVFFNQVLVSLYKFGLIDASRMTGSIQNYFKEMKSAYDMGTALNELQRIYNYRRRQQIFFRDRYCEKMQEEGVSLKIFD